SPSGVLIDIPVMAIRSVFDKVNLHHSECTDGFVPNYLTGTDRGVVVLTHNRSNHIEALLRSDFGEKRRMMNPHGTETRCRDFSQETHETQSELADCFKQQYSRINRRTGEVAGEDRIIR